MSLMAMWEVVQNMDVESVGSCGWFACPIARRRGLDGDTKSIDKCVAHSHGSGISAFDSRELS